MRLYLSIAGSRLTKSKRRRIVTITVLILCLMTASTLWFNFVIQYYYIVHLKSTVRLEPEDRYFSAVYYTTNVLNELNFCLLLFMAFVFRRYSRVSSSSIASGSKSRKSRNGLDLS